MIFDDIICKYCDFHYLGLYGNEEDLLNVIIPLLRINIILIIIIMK